MKNYHNFSMIGQNRAITPLLVMILGISLITPAFGEVSTIQINKSSFVQGDEIVFSGTLDEDLRGLVSIVIRDPNDDFVMLAQAIIEPDGTYKKSVEVDSGFEVFGNYNATAFVYNMTSGKTMDFRISSSISESKPTPVIEKVSIPAPPEIPESKIADFVDPAKDPIEYVERYYNEANYKAWFDRNYPGITIEEAVGYQAAENAKPQLSENKIIPNAEASSEISDVGITSENGIETGPMALAIGGLVVLFGAVYGIKRQVDNNSRQISLNREKIKQKLGGIFRVDPLGVLGNRLAKGEISIEEYTHLVKTLNQN